MTLEEIRNSGLLEGYVIGNLSAEERSTVEQSLKEFPVLRQDLMKIEQAFEAYAKTQGVSPRPTLKESILKRAKEEVSNGSNDTKSNGFGPFFWPTILLGALLMAALLWGNSNRNEKNTYKADLDGVQATAGEQKIVCDSISAENTNLKLMLEHLTDSETEVFALSPTGNFNQTKIYLHSNDNLKLNYIQALALPSIAADKAFQLWSLKEGQDPIPLTVFKNAENLFVPVDFEEGTSTYAITIEAEKGASVPDLEQLIGTIKV